MLTTLSMLTILRSVPTRTIHHLTSYVDVVLVDRAYTGCLSFVKQLFMMRSLNDDILFLEDDISISPHQYDFIRKIISQYPDTLINFSSRRVKDGFLPPKTFQFTQCVYFPKRVIRMIVDNLNVDEFLKFSHYDIALREIMTEDYLSIYYKKAITDCRLKSVMKYY